jgi:phosphoenolpyruvate---glycerone phosphotransferase subunit DhaL
MSLDAITVDRLRDAGRRIATAVAAAAEELNAQDAKLGDGDLGITVAKGWAEVSRQADALPEDLGQAFHTMAKAFQRASPSSFGTLTATAFMSAAKATKGRMQAPWEETSKLLGGARDAMMARGKGTLGDKSVLDMIDAMAKATEGLSARRDLLQAVDSAAHLALETFRDKPSKLGRARMFGEKSIGLDDPGMLAVRRMLDGLIS